MCVKGCVMGRHGKGCSESDLHLNIVLHLHLYSDNDLCRQEGVTKIKVL